VERGLPPCIIRELINMYVTQQACVYWAGIISDYVSEHNGVRQALYYFVFILAIYYRDCLNLVLDVI